MKTTLIAVLLLFAAVTSFAKNGCEYKGAHWFDDISIPSEFKRSFLANEYTTTYLICRSKKTIPAGSTIEFIFNNGSYVQVLDNKTTTFMTPHLSLINNGKWDYFTVSVNLNPGWPNQYSYECEHYLCK